jgi:8-oxo-dGTP pyrophosphatase MutT (NUDIX family)
MENQSKSRKDKVQVWIFAQNEQRPLQTLIFKTQEARGGFWQPVTGSVESFDISLEQAAVRELLEETGIFSKVHPIGYSFEFMQDQQCIVETGFYAYLSSFPHIVLDPNEHQAFEWVDLAVADERIKFDSNKKMLQNALFLLKKND